MESATIPVEDWVDSLYMSPWAQKQYLDKYAMKDRDGEPIEVWPDTAYRVTRHVLGALGYTDRDWEFQATDRLITRRQFIPGGRYLANAGKQLHQCNNCTLYRAEDSREGWMDIVRKAGMALMLGSGVGIVWTDIRSRGTRIEKTNGVASGSLSPAQMVNEVARHVLSGGNRRSAIWGGIQWDHGDVLDWTEIKNWPEAVRRAKEADYNNPAPLDMTNISIILNTEFFFAYENPKHPKHQLAQDVYWKTVNRMLYDGDPGFSIDAGENEGENLRNACCEITSYYDSDICNLGSLNMARFDTLEEFSKAVRMGELFLIAGSVYSDVPHDEIRAVRDMTRRTGLGLMGIHEWLMKRGYRYEVIDELREWLAVYEQQSDLAAEDFATHHNISIPVKRRAIAPNGTIQIVGETIGGAEPIPAVAYQRRFLDEDQVWRYQYVISPTAERLIEQEGIDPYMIESSYDLAHDYERRMEFQADVQEYVDHAVSSTINLPERITDPIQVKAFGETLYKYLPSLRGITIYPNGARPGQPITPVDYYEAKEKIGVTFEEDEETCKGGVCGI